VSLHRVSLDAPLPPVGSAVTLAGDEAWHAVAVKRVRGGDSIELLDGRGTVATAAVTASDKRKGGATLTLKVEGVRREPPVRPRVEVWSAVPKGDRSSQMIDQLAQAGAALWRPLESERGVTDADHKIDRLRRIALEASKQCGRAWHMELGAPATVQEAAGLAASSPAVRVLTADADGSGADSAGADRVVVLVGPEGGFTEDELAALTLAGAGGVRLGPHILRTETAAVAAAVALLSR